MARPPQRALPDIDEGRHKSYYMIVAHVKVVSPMQPLAASLPRERLHDRLTREIALGILRGGIGQGESALSTEGDLCRHFNVSRTILREAVKVLAAKGLIEVRPRTGIRVRPRDEWNLVDPDLLGWLCEAGVD